MKITEHFLYEELVRSDYAINHRIENKPNKKQLANIVKLCKRVLEPVRLEFGKPIFVTSGFRSGYVNKAVGGVYGSYHMRGLAADIVTLDDADLDTLFNILKKNQYVDLVLLEHKGSARWIHVQTSDHPRHGFNPHYDVK